VPQLQCEYNSHNSFLTEDSDEYENDFWQKFYKSGSKTTKQSSEGDTVHELKASHQDVAKKIARQNDNS